MKQQQLLMNHQSNLSRWFLVAGFGFIIGSVLLALLVDKHLAADGV
jgi:hypothetical protein